MTDAQISSIESKIGYVFNDKQLLINALTHSSYINENKGRSVSYDRLEFLGDSILDFIVAEDLYFSLNQDEGEMTQLRAKIVSREPLADDIDDIGLLPFMRIGNGARSDVVNSQKTKSDLFESVLAAIYIDCGRNLDQPRKFVHGHIRRSLAINDSKTALQIYTQRNYKGEIPRYTAVENLNGQPRFTVTVSICGKEIAKGEGGSKKIAEQNSAYHALKTLKVIK
ncbi:MAG: ribonuclease III [Clostridia bacterium]|nr:ribonuclease III [Clostridia bacterium]